MKVKHIKEIEPLESNCISVDSHDKLFAIGENSNLMTHNSVSQQNIIISCVLRPENWALIGIDLKRVELTKYRKFGVKVATDIYTAVDFLRFAQAVMMKRYERMEELGVNDFEDLPEKLQALMVMIDEAGELLSASGAKALSENTIVQMADGTTKLLKEVKVGDMLLDNYTLPTKVTHKYEPTAQKHYHVKISNRGSQETFISGAEHFWVIYLDNNGPALFNTDLIHEFIKAKRNVKIKRTSGREVEWFTIDNIEEIEPKDKLYCISVDSKEKQFLIGELGIPTHNTDEAKEQDELKGEAKMIIGSIARLGRASGVHLVIATQRPDAELIPGETRDNLGVRIGCGVLKSSASTMLFQSGIGQRIHANPPGGMYVQIHGKGNMGQGFFAPNDWLENYYAEHGNPAGAVKPLEIVEDLSDTAKKKEKEFIDYWDEDMEALHEAGES